LVLDLSAVTVTKGTFAVLLMAVVDVNYIFLIINVGLEGRNSDGWGSVGH